MGKIIRNCFVNRLLLLEGLRASRESSRDIYVSITPLVNFIKNAVPRINRRSSREGNVMSSNLSSFGGKVSRGTVR